MLNYRQWVADANQFVLGLEGRLDGRLNINDRKTFEPPTSSELDRLRDAVGRKLPRPLLDFFRQSGGIDCRYWWEPPPAQQPDLHAIFPWQTFIFGGPRQFCTVDAMIDNFQGCQDWAEGIAAGGKASLEHEQFLWSHALPFAPIGNGDYLAFDLAADSDDPPVLYLDHDEERSARISRNFDSFLTAWSRLCYIGPEIWLLSFFFSGDLTFADLNANHPLAPKLRRLFGLPEAKP
jgi:hypothetical protein